ncbi:MAG: hypothetical protein JO149_06895 [Gammaproteobacteria bacterium]|nr:hypothetical protein [Gammaproteobacteria bacterium]
MTTGNTQTLLQAELKKRESAEYQAEQEKKRQEQIQRNQELKEKAALEEEQKKRLATTHSQKANVAQLAEKFEKVTHTYNNKDDIKLAGSGGDNRQPVANLTSPIVAKPVVEDIVLPKVANVATHQPQPDPNQIQAPFETQEEAATPQVTEEKEAEDYLSRFACTIYVQTYNLQLALTANGFVLQLVQQTMLINLVGNKDHLDISIDMSMEASNLIAYQQFGLFGTNMPAQFSGLSHANQGPTIEEIDDVEEEITTPRLGWK